VRPVKVGTITWTLDESDADTGIITEGSPFSGINNAEIAKVPSLNPVPVIVSESNELAVVSLSELIWSADDAAVIVTVAEAVFVVSARPVAVTVTRFVLGTVLGAV
jgi:hypothetical protein